MKKSVIMPRAEGVFAQPRLFTLTLQPKWRKGSDGVLRGTPSNFVLPAAPDLYFLISIPPPLPPRPSGGEATKLATNNRPTDRPVSYKGEREGYAVGQKEAGGENKASLLLPPSSLFFGPLA